MPLIVRSSVVFPVPFGPRSAAISPSASEKVTLSNTGTPL